MDTKDTPKTPPSLDYEELARKVDNLNKKPTSHKWDPIPPPPRSISPSPESASAVRIQIGGAEVKFKDTSFLSKMFPYIMVAFVGGGVGAGGATAAAPEIPPGVLALPSQVEVLRTDLKKIEERLNTVEQDGDDVKRREIPRLKRDIEGLVTDYENLRKGTVTIVK